MSYCVNCGVELDDSAAKCALCNTPVYNPNCPPAESPAPYSEKIVLPPPVRRRLTAFIASMVLLLPNLVCLLTNLLFPIEGEGVLSWAKYVNTTSLLIWILFFFPFLWKRVRAYALVPLDAAAILGYVYFYYYTFNRQNPDNNWFLYVALPIVLVLEVFATATIEWCTRKKPDWPDIMMLLFMETGVYAVTLESSLDFFFFGRPQLTVSLIVLASCIAITLFFFAVKRNKRLRAWLSRNFFF